MKKEMLTVQPEDAVEMINDLYNLSEGNWDLFKYNTELWKLKLFIDEIVSIL